MESTYRERLERLGLEPADVEGLLRQIEDGDHNAKVMVEVMERRAARRARGDR